MTSEERIAEKREKITKSKERSLENRPRSTNLTEKLRNWKA